MWNGDRTADGKEAGGKKATTEELGPAKGEGEGVHGKGY